jgi:hypothetical protein
MPQFSDISAILRSNYGFNFFSALVHEKKQLNERQGIVIHGFALNPARVVCDEDNDLPLTAVHRLTLVLSLSSSRISKLSSPSG